MQRRVMQETLLKILAMALLMSLPAFGQSLGDIARENRDKQNADGAPSTAKPKVITNENLPKAPDANPGPPEAPPSASATIDSKAADRRSRDQRVSNRRAAEQRLAEQRAADQWKRQILAQKNKMAALQARIEQLNAAIRSEYGTVQYETPSNSYQARRLQRVAQIQEQLDEQKKELAEMQEAARRAGMHTPVYDP